jgi:hypothetical protein
MYRVNGQSLCAHSAVPAGREVIDLPRANRHSNQAKSGKTDSGGHPPHLTITTLANRDLKPSISDGFPLPDGRVSWPYRRRGYGLGFSRAGQAIF